MVGDKERGRIIKAGRKKRCRDSGTVRGYNRLLVPLIPLLR
jgi:hypothetical protein